VALLWLWIFNPRFGTINVLLSYLGVQGPLWLGDEAWAMPALIVMSVWGVGGGMLIYLGALQGIPTALYEAATIDGAGPWRKFLSITVPMVTPVLLLNLVMGRDRVVPGLHAGVHHDQRWPNYATFLYVYYLYQNAFEWFNMGYAAALSWVLFLIILACTFAIMRTSSRWVYYEAE